MPLSNARVTLLGVSSTDRRSWHMQMMRRGAVAALVVGSMGGGALGATVISAASSSAATTTTATAAPAPPSGYGYPGGPQNGGKFKSNENAAHEKGESAQREAQETAGQFPTVP
jgi:hypothetical protein